MHNNSILITGGAGNVGSSLAAKLATLNYQVIIVDNLLTGAKKKIPDHKNVRFIKADVNDFNDISAIFYAHQFDFVFHYAAVVGVKRTLANPLMVLEDIKGIENILKLCKNTGVKRVFYSSSSEVYGEPFEIPQHELTTPLNSRLPYAIVKNVGEAYFKSYQQEFGLDYTIFRFFNTYGLNQSEDFVVPKFLKAALRGDTIKIYGDGLQTRTFCYIDDNIQATVNAFQENLCINDVVNIGNDQEMTILELSQKVIAATNSRSKIEHVPALEEGDMTRRCPNISKMKTLLNKKLTPLEEGLEKLISFNNQPTPSDKKI